jgi:molecular chaperone DnaJ
VILGLGADATQTEIKKRYRELAKQYHPDATNQDKYKEVKFKEICMAYEDLTDS